MTDVSTCVYRRIQFSAGDWLSHAIPFSQLFVKIDVP